MAIPLRLYTRTMPYTLARFGLALSLSLCSGILLVICLKQTDGLGVSLASLIESLTQEALGEDGPLMAMLCPWLAGTIALRFAFMH